MGIIFGQNNYKKRMKHIDEFKLNENVKSPWQIELEKIDRVPQRQDSLDDQLNDLITIANRFGFYDAADYLRYTVLKKENVQFKESDNDKIEYGVIVNNKGIPFMGEIREAEDGDIIMFQAKGNYFKLKPEELVLRTFDHGKMMKKWDYLSKKHMKKKWGNNAGFM